MLYPNENEVPGCLKEKDRPVAPKESYKLLRFSAKILSTLRLMDELLSFPIVFEKLKFRLLKGCT